MKTHSEKHNLLLQLDKGGPLMVCKEDEKCYLYGVLYQARSDGPSLYFNVPQMLPWIKGEFTP